MSDAPDRVLIVEDDQALRAALVRIVERNHPRIVEVATLADALAFLEEETPELVLLDVRLPDGSGVEVAEAAAHMSPRPTVIAVSGGATPSEAFGLARAGVSHYLAKPFTVPEFEATLEAARNWVPCIDPLVAQSVGKRELQDLISNVRTVMVDEALAKADGSRRGAARHLGVSRQAVQQMVRRRELRTAEGRERP